MSDDNGSWPRVKTPSVGKNGPDAEHRVQMGFIRAAREALATGDPASAELMAQLCDYTELHFLSEQLLLRMSARPGHDDHVAEHERLLKDIHAVRVSLERGEPERASRRLEAHERDILDHICSWDRSI